MRTERSKFGCLGMIVFLLVTGYAVHVARANVTQGATISISK